MTPWASADTGIGQADGTDSKLGMTRRMSPRQLKALIQTGHYRMEPVLVAEAMLERPGVRAFLAREGEEAKTRQLVVAPHSELAAAGSTELHPFTRDAAPDHGEGTARIGDRRAGAVQRTLRAGRREARSPRPRRPPAPAGPRRRAIATSRTPGLKRHRPQVDLQPHPALGGDVTGVGAEAVADVDHRARPARGQRPALGQARLRVELAGAQGVREVLRQAGACTVALQQP